MLPVVKQKRGSDGGPMAPMGFHNLNFQRQRPDGTLADLGADGMVLPGEDIRLSAQFLPAGEMTYTISHLEGFEVLRRTVTAGLSGTSFVDTTAPVAEGGYRAEARTGGIIQHSSTLDFIVSRDASEPARDPKIEPFKLFGIQVDEKIIFLGLAVVGIVAVRGIIS